MALERKCYLRILFAILMILLCACSKEDRVLKESSVGKIAQAEKGYDLPFAGEERKEAENDCKMVMEKLDYNGIFEYLYEMKYQEKFNFYNCPNGILKEEFDSVIMEYLPITADEIREYSVYNDELNTYSWMPLGCLNYDPTFFATSLPEVTNIEENEGGTTTLIVDAVCSDTVITHKLTENLRMMEAFGICGMKF